MRVASPSRAPSSRRAISCLPSSSSSNWRTRSRSAAACGVDQIGLPAHDQHRARRAVLAPHRKTALDQRARRAVERGAFRADLALQPLARLAERQARRASRSDNCAASSSAPGVRPRRQLDDAVLDRSVLADQHRQRLPSRQRHEADLAQRRLAPAAPAPGPRRPTGRTAPQWSRRSPPRPGRRRPPLRLDRGAFLGASAPSPASSRRRTGAGRFRSASARRWCAARRAAQPPPDPASRCGSRPATG